MTSSVEPVVSEKSYDLIEDFNTYTFVVDPRANKTEIKQAIQTIFDVKVVKVNTMNRKGKQKRTGGCVGKRADIKRACHARPRRRRSTSSGCRRLGLMLKKYKPTSPGRRFRTVSDFAEITKTEAGEVPARQEGVHRRPQRRTGA